MQEHRYPYYLVYPDPKVHELRVVQLKQCDCAQQPLLDFIRRIEAITSVQSINFEVMYQYLQKRNMEFMPVANCRLNANILVFQI